MFLWDVRLKRCYFILFYLLSDARLPYRFGIIPEFDVWLAQLPYLRVVKTARNNYLMFCPRSLYLMNSANRNGGPGQNTFASSLHLWTQLWVQECKSDSACLNSLVPVSDDEHQKEQLGVIAKKCLFKRIENFTTRDFWKFSDKVLIFHISAQNIDCGYSLDRLMPGQNICE